MSDRTETAPVLVLGVGNRLLRDDAVGLELLALARADYASDPRVELVDGGTQGLNLLGRLEGRRALVLLDAVDIDLAPGDVSVASDPAALVARRGIGAHGGNVSELLAMAIFTGNVPERVALIGVQVERVTTGIGLSDSVRAGVLRAYPRVRALLSQMLRETEATCTSSA
jgi:hydrogenase maturation protease